MKKAFVAVSVSSALFLNAAEPLNMDIKLKAGAAEIKWQGGSGMYQLQKREALGAGRWSAIGWPSRSTTAVRPVSQSQEIQRVESVTTNDLLVAENAQDMLAQGRQIFRFDTFGDEEFWGDALKLHQAVAGTNNGGVGPGLSPKMALQLGLKVDAEALPPDVVANIQNNPAMLDDPATTLALLKLNAVVGVTGFFDHHGGLRSMGIQCALCHSTVNDSFSAGIGQRLDGWPNRDLNVGAIIALAPDLSVITNLLQVSKEVVLSVLTNWGPGKFDAELVLDGKGFRPDGKTAATLLPAAFGLAGVNLHTYTGWGSVTHWNAFVANLEMHGKGTFYDPRLTNGTDFPVAARAGFDNMRTTNDLVTSKLPALHFYQLSIPAPEPPAGSFNTDAAFRGKALFNGAAKCATCHVPPIYTEPGWNMHTPAEIGIDAFQANRSPDKRYRTTPLKGLFARQKGGFYHDGRFAGYLDVINHYNTFFSLDLSDDQKRDLVEFLKSL
jgi:hypothetical protein